MGLIDFGKRVSRNAWRLPLVGQVLEMDYERSFAKRPPGRFRGVYATFAEAEAACPPGSLIGYDHAELAGMYRNRMEKANQSDYAVLFWLKGILGEKSFLFDFGGHVGVSYHGWRSYLNYKRARDSSSRATSPPRAATTSSWPRARCSTARSR
jgi:hypothetical protein